MGNADQAIIILAQKKAKNKTNLIISNTLLYNYSPMFLFGRPQELVVSKVALVVQLLLHRVLLSSVFKITKSDMKFNLHS